jgi:hypothetical protein
MAVRVLEQGLGADPWRLLGMALHTARVCCRFGGVGRGVTTYAALLERRRRLPMAQCYLSVTLGTAPGDRGARAVRCVARLTLHTVMARQLGLGFLICSEVGF